jgi:hypothetical protein
MKLQPETQLFSAAVIEISDDVLLKIFRHYSTWMPLHHFDLRLPTYAEGGDRSYLHLLWVYVSNCQYRTYYLRNTYLADSRLFATLPSGDGPQRVSHVPFPWMRTISWIHSSKLIVFAPSASLLKLAPQKAFHDLRAIIGTRILSSSVPKQGRVDVFCWGHRLCTLHSIRIAFPLLPQLLSPSQDLVDINLHEISGVDYYSPEAFANALCGMTQLQTLSLQSLSLPPLSWRC